MLLVTHEFYHQAGNVHNFISIKQILCCDWLTKQALLSLSYIYIFLPKIVPLFPSLALSITWPVSSSINLNLSHNGPSYDLLIPTFCKQNNVNSHFSIS